MVSGIRSNLQIKVSFFFLLHNVFGLYWWCPVDLPNVVSLYDGSPKGAVPRKVVYGPARPLGDFLSTLLTPSPIAFPSLVWCITGYEL